MWFFQECLTEEQIREKLGENKDNFALSVSTTIIPQNLVSEMSWVFLGCANQIWIWKRQSIGETVVLFNEKWDFSIRSQKSQTGNIALEVSYSDVIVYPYSYNLEVYYCPWSLHNVKSDSTGEQKILSLTPGRMPSSMQFEMP